MTRLSLRYHSSNGCGASVHSIPRGGVKLRDQQMGGTYRRRLPTAGRTRAHRKHVHIHPWAGKPLMLKSVCINGATLYRHWRGQPPSVKLRFARNTVRIHRTVLKHKRTSFYGVRRLFFFSFFCHGLLFVLLDRGRKTGFHPQ